MSESAFTYSSRSETDSCWLQGEYSESPSRKVDAIEVAEGDDNSEAQEQSSVARRTSSCRSPEDNDGRRMISRRSEHAAHTLKSLH